MGQAATRRHNGSRSLAVGPTPRTRAVSTPIPPDPCRPCRCPALILRPCWRVARTIHTAVPMARNKNGRRLTALSACTVDCFAPMETRQATNRAYAALPLVALCRGRKCRGSGALWPDSWQAGLIQLDWACRGVVIRSRVDDSRFLPSLPRILPRSGMITKGQACLVRFVGFMAAGCKSGCVESAGSAGVGQRGKSRSAGRRGALAGSFVANSKTLGNFDRVGREGSKVTPNQNTYSTNTRIES